MRLIRNPDKHVMDILYARFLSPYIGSEDTKGGFDVVDVRPDGSFTLVRRNEDELFWNYFGLVDVNQDGTDDLYLSYYQYDNTTTSARRAGAEAHGKGRQGLNGDVTSRLRDA